MNTYSPHDLPTAPAPHRDGRPRALPEHGLDEFITAAVDAPAVAPGNPSWSQRVTATKIPAIFGADPYGGTPFTMWHLLAGTVEPEVKKGAILRRGLHLEGGIADWWLDDHPGYLMADTRSWQSKAYPWAYATPDRILADQDTGEISLLEVKTARTLDDWGVPGTDQIPGHYWLQVAWQAIVLGVQTVHVTVLGPWLERQDYVIRFDSFELGSVLETVQDFVDSLPTGDDPGTPPMAENPLQDWKTLLAVTPVIRSQADVSALYPAYRDAKIAGRESGKVADEAQAVIKAAGADAEELVADGKVVATRSGAGFRFKPVK